MSENRSSDVMMSIPSDQFSDQLLLTLLRQLIDTNNATVSALHDVQLALASLEDKNLEERLMSGLRRLDVLEDSAQQRAGAVKLVMFLKDYAPWIVALLFAMWTFFERKPH